MEPRKRNAETLGICGKPNFSSFVAASFFAGRFSIHRGNHREPAMNVTFYGEAIMPLRKPLKPVVPNLVRKMPRSFAWIDHGLRTRQFLHEFEPEEFALYFFLSLAADQQGLSCWRLDVMEKTMPAFRFNELRNAREGLLRKRLLAYRPWNSNDPDGIYQLLPVPSMKPETGNNLQTILAGILKTV